MKTLTFTVPGTPFSKRRHRTVSLLMCDRCNKKHQGMYKSCPECDGPLRFLTNLNYSDSETTRFENLVAYAAQQAMKQQGVEMFTGAILVSPTFWFPIPVSRACKKHTEPTTDCKKLHPGDYHTQKPDRDNLDKAINDGMNGVVFPDDCIICDGRIQKFWAAEGRAEILVESLEG